MRSYFSRFAASIVAATLALGSCAPTQKNTQINTRIKSPDGMLEAIYAEDIGGGPAVGVTEEVFVVQRGAFPHLNERVFSEECVRNISLTWERPRTLRVSYDIGSDTREDSELAKPSLFSIFSSGYWTYSHPHGTQVRLARRRTPPSDGC
jgi:hypothetical protein